MASTAQQEPNRRERRRTETRRRLLAAARELFSERGVDATRAGDITERADVATGSLYNHFGDKQEIVDAILAETVESQGRLVDDLTAAIDDPAEVVAHAHRHFVQLAGENPVFAQLLLNLDASHRLLADILGPRATRDIQRGIERKRFDVTDPVLALHMTGGALIGTMRGRIDGVLGEEAEIPHAATVLRILGLDAAEATEVARRADPRGAPGAAKIRDRVRP